MAAHDDGGAPQELLDAVLAHGDLSFLAEVRVIGRRQPSESLTLHCSTLGGHGAIDVSATNFVTGIFKRRLGSRELTELRRGAGMEDFSWQSFLALLFAALRNERGCSCSAEDSVFGSSHLALTLCFSLHAATLSSRLELLAEHRSPGPELVTRPYLIELRRFFLSAMKAVKAPDDASHSRDCPTQVEECSSTLRRPDFTARAPTLVAPSLPTQAQEASAGFNYGVATMVTPVNKSVGPTPEDATVQQHVRAAPVPRKRPGGLLVTPGGSKPRSSNPFRLGA